MKRFLWSQLTDANISALLIDILWYIACILGIMRVIVYYQFLFHHQGFHAFYFVFNLISNICKNVIHSSFSLRIFQREEFMWSEHLTCNFLMTIKRILSVFLSLDIEIIRVKVVFVWWGEILMITSLMDNVVVIARAG